MITELLTKASDQFSETAFDDEVVVMSHESGDFFSLIGSSRTIWNLIDGTREKAALVSELAVQFDCGPADIAEDVESFIGQLSEAGLLAHA